MNDVDKTLPVIIVGAGPSGIATAIELASNGVSCIVIEQSERAGYAPRAKTTHVRTRELLRRWGIADKLAEASPFGVDYPSDVYFVTALSGKEIARIENAMYCAPEKDQRYSEHGQWIPQYKLEAVLRDHALSHPQIDIRYGCEFLSFSQDEQAVCVSVRTAGKDEPDVLIGSYLVGADGARSAVRRAMGASMEGKSGLSRNYNIIFRAPGMRDAHPHGPGIMYWQVNKHAPSMIGPMDQDDIWFFMPTGVPQDASYSAEDAADLIRRSTGIDLPIEVLSHDVWIANRLLATTYRAGRAYLVGDACHLHPPFGGYGMNMGVADGVDLGWKLAAVISGWGGEALLESYERERRPTHEYVLEEAESNHALIPHTMLRPHLDEESPEGEAARRDLAAEILANKPAEFRALGVVLGYCYDDSPIIVREPGEGSWQKCRTYQPSALPGSIAPHYWLDDGRSLYDLFGKGFTLLVFDTEHDDAVASILEEAAGLGVPVTVVPISNPSIAALYAEPLAVVRPDQHVAWRGAKWQMGLLSHLAGKAPLM